MIRSGKRVGEERREGEKGKKFMEWDLKASSWELSELEREPIPNITSIIGSSSIEGQKTKGDSLVDLKLGRLGDIGDGSVNKWEDPRVLKMVSSPSSSSKRARAPGNGTQTVSCLVDGCRSDLSNCRDYHRRHKVCEHHSKTPIVMVGGQQQRFCQQCSRYDLKCFFTPYDHSPHRFHMLAEFDDVKRSCRKRLDGHNRRRRKPQPESMSINSGSLFSSHQGTRLLPFTGAQIFPTTTVVGPTWAGVVKTEDDATLYNRHSQLHFIDRQMPGSFPCSYKEAKQFPFLQGNDPTLGHQMTPEASICQPLLNTIASSGSGGGSQKMFSDGLPRVLDSDCALSLLSLPRTQTSGISLSHVVQADSIPMAQRLFPSMQYNDLGRYSCSQGMEDEPVDSVMVPDVNNADIHCQGIFQMGLSGNEAPQTLPFSWGQLK
ncbi:hypothetical protein HHK36_015860 [Tetracentron sinense]|uniref:SBP-type domain-containing protein n=1 Tax=Tetracentron sinense TaxID=13715 RepID=A0A834Z5Y8_TETSI|nr:hypothetical protein HHK36_015860 [Tetracentron sinense]